MNGRRTRTFQNVRYDLVLNDDYFDKYDDFDPTGPSAEEAVNEAKKAARGTKKRRAALQKLKNETLPATKNTTKGKKANAKKSIVEDVKNKLNVKKKFSNEKKAAKVFDKGAAKINKKLGISKNVGRAAGKASSAAGTVDRWAKGDTKKKGHLNEIKNKESVFDLLKNEQELNKAEFDQLKTAMKDISALERVIFKLSGQDGFEMRMAKKAGAMGLKGAKRLGKGLFAAGKKGIGLINRIPGGKPMSARGALKMARGGGAILRKGSQGLKRGLGVLSSGGKGASKALGKAFSTGGLAAKQAAKKAAAAAAAASRALAKKMETPVNDEPGFCIWMFTNCVPCLMIKIFAPVCCCSALTEEKAESQAKRDRPRKARTV